MNQYIGGDFDKRSTEAFLEKGECGTPFYFPETLGNKRRYLFETGSDAIAQIILSIYNERARSPLRICMPEHYCSETIHRFSHKFKHLIPNTIIDFYTGEEEKSLIGGYTNVILLNHFNTYQKKNADLAHSYKALGWVTVEDFVHAPFDMTNMVGDFAFNSLRKFLSLEISVAYLSLDEIEKNTYESEYYPLKKQAAAKKSEFIMKPDAVLEDQYLSLFKEAEKALENVEITFAKDEEISLFKRINWNNILEARKKNYAFLADQIKGLGNIIMVDGQYAYLMVKTLKRNELEKDLRGQGIYPVVHWRDSRAAIRDQLLSFHIDQRYSEADMKRMSDRINFFLKD